MENQDEKKNCTKKNFQFTLLEPLIASPTPEFIEDIKNHFLDNKRPIESAIFASRENQIVGYLKTLERVRETAKIFDIFNKYGASKQISPLTNNTLIVDAAHLCRRV
eukprot:TRINITY_DN19078_c0_g1_i1.p1 TRINITY_DN19078_c0_g1~~TRINITY_DN19078_c0_g1_i1.p1  ORF type:complete len:107 (-),score=9.10 TRINITY_DN19078_c0_g1_i1:161-481(-)